MYLLPSLHNYCVSYECIYYLVYITVLAVDQLYTMTSVSQITWRGLDTSVSKVTPLGVVQCGHFCKKTGDSGSLCNAFKFEEQTKICTIGVLNVNM